MSNKLPKLWKRAERVVRECECGKTLCRFNRTRENGLTEVIYYLEPGGDKVGRRTAENAIICALVANDDGLFGADSAQTWSAPR